MCEYMHVCVITWRIIECITYEAFLQSYRAFSIHAPASNTNTAS